MLAKRRTNVVLFTKVKINYTKQTYICVNYEYMNLYTVFIPYGGAEGTGNNVHI